MGGWIDTAFWSIDSTIYQFVQEHIWCGFLDRVFTFITHLGDGGMVWIAFGVALLLFKKTRKAGFTVLISLLVGLLVTDVCIKEWVCRVRPYLTHPEIQLRFIQPESSFSFPSGHTTSSFAAAAAFFMVMDKRWSWTPGILAVAIAFSRIYVQVHYPTDVLFGVVIGTLCGLIGWILTKKLWEFIVKKTREKKGWNQFFIE